MKKFDLEKAKAGAPIVTRDGRPARLLGERKHYQYPVIAVIENGNGIEEAYTYTTDGFSLTGVMSGEDLFMAPEKHKKYVNFYFHEKNGYEIGFLHDNERNAKSNISTNKESRFIKTIEIEWEE